MDVRERPIDSDPSLLAGCTRLRDISLATHNPEVLRGLPPSLTSLHVTFLNFPGALGWAGLGVCRLSGALLPRPPCLQRRPCCLASLHCMPRPGHRPSGGSPNTCAADVDSEGEEEESAAAELDRAGVLAHLTRLEALVFEAPLPLSEEGRPLLCVFQPPALKELSLRTPGLRSLPPDISQLSRWGSGGRMPACLLPACTRPPARLCALSCPAVPVLQAGGARCAQHLGLAG